jgi:hypothetical protein
MPFSYYQRLTIRQRRIYDRSDAIQRLTLPQPGDLRPLAGALGAALESASRAATETASQRLAAGIHRQFAVPAVELRVLAARPSRTWGELHGLYEFGGGRQRARITLWMRTAQKRQVVAFRTYLRTLLHEVCHHLDYALLELPDSFHTQGFYQRESSLFHQLMGTADAEAEAGAAESDDETR